MFLVLYFYRFIQGIQIYKNVDFELVKVLVIDIFLVKSSSSAVHCEGSKQYKVTFIPHHLLSAREGQIFFLDFKNFLKIFLN